MRTVTGLVRPAVQRSRCWRCEKRKHSTERRGRGSERPEKEGVGGSGTVMVGPQVFRRPSLIVSCQLPLIGS